MLFRSRQRPNPMHYGIYALLAMHYSHFNCMMMLSNRWMRFPFRPLCKSAGIDKNLASALTFIQRDCGLNQLRFRIFAILILLKVPSLNSWSRSGAVYRVGLRLLWKPKVVSSILAAIVSFCSFYQFYTLTLQFFLAERYTSLGFDFYGN